MDYFKYVDNHFFCENVNVTKIAEKIGTPFYLYSSNTLREHYNHLYDAFSAVNPLICFSMKTCNNIHLLKELINEGAGIDTVSGGEIYLALKSGVSPDKIVYAGIGKTDEEIELAIENNIGLINVESEEEYINIARIAKEKNKKVKAAIRVTPDVVDDRTHDKTKTGYRGSKFGVDIDVAKEFFIKHSNNPNVDLCGIHIHIGSPIYSPEPYVLAINKILSLIDTLHQHDINITVFDIGGGYAADYTSGMSVGFKTFADAIIPLLQPYYDKGIKIIMEPGRTISGNSGVLITRVNYIKKGGDKLFAVVDTGMHHLIRPALYDASHFIWPAEVTDETMISNRLINENTENLQQYDIVGPICESSDYLAKNRFLPTLTRGDLLVVYTAGAYGMVMSSQYNAMPRPPEILVDGDKVYIIREREKYEDLLLKITKEEILSDN